MGQGQYDDYRFVRLYPFNPSLGHTVRRYMHKRTLYREERGWYKVPKELGEELAKARKFAYSIDSPGVFQVCTFEEAREIHRDELVQKDPRRSIEDAVSKAMRDAIEVEGTPKVKKRSSKKTATKKKKTLKKKKSSDK